MKRKIAVIATIVLALAIILVPRRLQYEDGGSVEYKALTYSITKYHCIAPVESGRGFDEGWKIKLFGITLRDDLADLKY